MWCTQPLQRMMFDVHMLIPCPTLLLQDCELLYVAFDLLHNGRTALTERPLSERLELLRRAVVPGEAGAASRGGMWCMAGIV